jgi:hypothetical protein
MFKKLWNWMARRDLEQRQRHAAAHYALCLSAGNTRRAARLKKVIEELRVEQST